MILEYLYLSLPTLLALVCFHWWHYRDMRKRRIHCYRQDVLHHTVLLLIAAKKSGHIDGDLPDYDALNQALFVDNDTADISLERFSESMQFCSNISKYPELFEHYKKLSMAAIQLGFAQHPGKTVTLFGLVSGVLSLGFGIHSFKKLIGKKSEMVGGSILSRLPIRFC